MPDDAQGQEGGPTCAIVLFSVLGVNFMLEAGPILAPCRFKVFRVAWWTRRGGTLIL